MKSKIFKNVLLLTAVILCPLLMAQEDTSVDYARVGRSIFSTVGYGFLGIIMSILGFKLFDRLTPFHLEKEIVKEKNIPVAIVCAAMILGICMIVSMTIFS